MNSFENKQNLNFIINNVEAIVYAIDVNNYKILYSNDKCKEEFGEDIDGKVCYEVLQKGKKEACVECTLFDNNRLKVNDSLKWEHLNTLNNKTYLLNEKIVNWGENSLAKLQIGIDITEQKKLEQKLYKYKDETIKTFEALTNATIEGLIIYNENKTCINVNKVAPELLGYKKEEMIGKKAFEFISEESIKYVSKVIKKENQEPYEAVMLRKDGTKFPAIIRGKDILLNNEKIRVSAVIDITKMKEKEKQIEKLAYYDSVTALPNKILLVDRLEQHIKRSNRTKKFGALFFIDLDNFKGVNDTKGHILGDKFLKKTAERLLTTLRQSDTVSRFGGDEFVLLTEIDTNNKNKAMYDAQTIALKILKKLKEPFFLENMEFRITASMGIVLFNNEKYSVEDLIKFADTAMYDAKTKGKNRFSFFDPKLQEEVERKTILTEKLRKAIEDKKINLNYQIQVNKDEKVIGAEVLARWIDDEFGFISPAEFIPIAEESGFIIEMGNNIIDESLSLLSSWKEDKRKKDWRLSINISVKQFERKEFEEFLRSKIEYYKIDPNKIRLELTESLFLNDVKKALKKINSLKKLGVSFSIDDFGTGYSSLSYLKKLPIDEIKIDKSFIDNILKDENDEIIVNVIVTLGEKFGIEVIAEGIETEQMKLKLESLGCSFYQGYYFAKPVPKEEL